MSAPVQNNPPTQKRSRIVINLERARNAMHFHPHGQQPYGGKRRKWPIVLGIIGIVLIVGVVVAGLHERQTPLRSGSAPIGQRMQP